MKARLPSRALPTWCGLALSTVSLAVLSLACNERKPIPFELHFTVTADGTHPIPGVQISARGRPLGATNGSGQLQAQVGGFEGDRLPIAVTCPDGYAAEPAESTVILRSIQGLGGEARRPIGHSLGCQPLKRDAVVVVRADGDVKSLPVKIDGEVVGQTDSLGYAHFHLRTDPGSRFEVTLDTSGNEKLMPQNPRQAFQVDERDELFVFDKSFKLPPPPKPKRRYVRRKKKPEPHRPVRLQ